MQAFQQSMSVRYQASANFRLGPSFVLRAGTSGLEAMAHQVCQGKLSAIGCRAESVVASFSCPLTVLHTVQNVSNCLATCLVATSRLAEQNSGQ